MTLSNSGFRHWLWAGRLGWLMLALWGLCACATMRQDTSPDQWRCDPRADEAVENGQWRPAMIYHQQIVAQDPSNCLALYHLGYIVGQLGDRTQETALYEKAITCGYRHDDRLFFNLGMAYGELDRQEDALAAFENAVAVNPHNADNYFGLGLMAKAAGQPVRAVQTLERAVALSPQHWEARLLLARIYLDQDLLTAARGHLESVLKGAPENEEAHELWETLQSRQMTRYER